MWLIVVEDGIAEHGGGGRVADIQAHPHSAVEQLDREMVGVAMIEKHTGTLASLHHQGEVERSRGVEGVQLDVGVGSCKLDGGQVLATLARIAWVALASIGRWRGGKTGAMSARSSLAWRSLLVGRHLKCRKINQSKEEKNKGLLHLHTGRRLTKHPGISRRANARGRANRGVATARSVLMKEVKL